MKNFSVEQIENLLAKMHQKPAMRAVIREDECIGCTKCIQACPADAILGAAKQMHTIIADACTGCELCIEPCPVDCIDMLHLSESDVAQQRAEHARQRYIARNLRLEKKQQAEIIKHQQQKIKQRKMEIALAVERVKQKRKLDGR